MNVLEITLFGLPPWLGFLYIVLAVIFPRRKNRWQLGKNQTERLRFARKYWWLFVLWLLPLVIFLPVLERGYILQFDMVFAPQAHVDVQEAVQGFITPNILFTKFVLYVFHFIIPIDIVQKLILLGIFAASSLSMYRLAPLKTSGAKVIAGLFYAYNPFVYDRLMAGHWQFLIAYAMTPLFVYVLWKALTTPNTRRYQLLAVALWAIAATINAHHFLLFGLLALILGGFFIRQKQQFVALLQIIFGVVVLNAWWLGWLLLTDNFTKSIDSSHTVAFQASADPDAGIWVTLLTLQGFWHEGWQLVRESLPFWYLLAAIWLLPVLIGMRSGVQSRKLRKFSLSFVVVIVVSLILAAGFHPDVSAINSWLLDNVPGFKGLRELQKFTALTALALAIFYGLGSELLLTKVKKYKPMVVAALVTIIFTMTGPLWFGANGQLKTVDYPAAWFEAEQYFADNPNDKIVVLPWSLYVTDSFTGNLVVQPAKSFFGPRTVVSRDANLPGFVEWRPENHQKIFDAVENEDVGAFRGALLENDATLVLDVSANGSASRWLAGSNEWHTIKLSNNVRIFKLNQ